MTSNPYRQRLLNKLVGVLALGLFLLSSAAPPGAFAADEAVVNVYSARKEELILPLLQQFEDQTGVRVNLITGKADALLKRLEVEGQASPADVFITVDAGRLYRAKEAGLLQAVSSESFAAAVPEHLRDGEGYWVGLSQRARTLFYSKDKVSAQALSTYEALADTRWKGRICIRSSGNIYNQSLVASMITAEGEAQTEAWAKGLVANFARAPAGGDTDQLRAAAAGVCDVAIANTYYFARLLNSDQAADREVAEKLAVFWPNQGEGERGVHVNVSGAGVTKFSKHRANAIALVEFLTSPEAQAWYAAVNNEYPVVEGVEISETLRILGEFRADGIALSKLGENNRAAVELMDRAGWK